MTLFVCIVVCLVVLAVFGACCEIQRVHNAIHGRNRNSENRSDIDPHPGSHMFMSYDIWSSH